MARDEHSLMNTKWMLNNELAWTNSLDPDADNQKTAMFLQIPSLYVVLWASA